MIPSPQYEHYEADLSGGLLHTQFERTAKQSDQQPLESSLFPSSQVSVPSSFPFPQD